MSDFEKDKIVVSRSNYYPKDGEHVYFVNWDCFICGFYYDPTNVFDAILVKMGNCFKTEKAAADNVEEMQSRFGQLLHYAKALSRKRGGHDEMETAAI